MRIRYPFAGAFVACLLFFSYIALSTIEIPQANSQFLHFIAFFILTVTFYWIFDSTRRRVLNFTLLGITIFLGLGAEAAQGFAAAREFDPLNIAANILGSLAGLGLCSIYHRRMLDRRRKAKGYGVVQQDEENLELGGQEIGIVDNDEGEPASAEPDGGIEDGGTSK